MKTPRRVRFTLGFLLSIACVFQASAQSNTVVAAQGAVMSLQSGTYGDLFPEGSETTADSQVLALDISSIAGPARILVPETEGVSAETPLALHFEKNSGLTYLLWKGLFNGVHPFLYLTSFDGTDFLEVIQIAGNVFSEKGDAFLAILPEGGPVTKSDLLGESSLERTIIYGAWWEETPTGIEHYVAPIILQGGQYVGWHPTYRLSSLLDDSQAWEKLREDSRLGEVLRIQPCTGSTALGVGFISEETGRLMTLEFEMLPRELTELAEHVKRSIVEHSETSASMDELVENVHTSLLEFGAQSFHEGFLEHLGRRITELLESRPGVASARAPGFLDKLGPRIAHIGGRLKATGLVDSAPLMIDILDPSFSGQGPYHHLKISLLSQRPVPDIDVNSDVTLFLSRTCHEALVAWRDADSIYFIESQGAQWGETQSVELDKLGEDAVMKMLEERTLIR